MEKNIKDYLHLYIGRECLAKCDGNEKIGKITGIQHFSGVLHAETFDAGGYGLIMPDEEEEWVKPILRPLSDMTEEELKQIPGFGRSDANEFITNKGVGIYPHEFCVLLKQGFDLFGLIESGLAIDKTKQPTT